MSFWKSDLGVVSGSQEDAFTQSFSTIPNDTTAIAKIDAFTLRNYQGVDYYEVCWKITTGDFKNRIVFQKIHAFDTDSNKRHRSLNMLMLLYKLFSIQPPDTRPTDNDLRQFIGKHAGLKIQEWQNNGKEGNWVSEVHPANNFVCETGIKLPKEQPEQHQNDSLNDNAFSRQRAEKEKPFNPELNDDVPF